MSRAKNKLRFFSARQVIEAFPVLQREFEREKLDTDPVAFVRHLEQDKKQTLALTFCCYLLPRHDAIIWLCQSLRSLPVAWSEAEEKLLATAEKWADSPSESLRWVALKGAMASGLQSAPAWAAAAVGWSGGSISPNPDHPIQAPIHLTGQAAKTGMIFAVSKLPANQQMSYLKQATERALSFIEA